MRKTVIPDIALGMINLTQTDLATEDDRVWGIDFRAHLFKATTWEELTLTAQKSLPPA